MKVRSVVLAALGVLAPACAGASEHVVAFEPGQHQTSLREVGVELVEARYAERQLTVTVSVRNDADASLTLDPAGVLLDDDGLELTPTPPASTAPSGPVTLAPGEHRPMVFTFALAGHEPRARTLGLWVLLRGDDYLPPLRVDVPGIRLEPS